MRIAQTRLDEAVTAVRKAAREEREQLQKELMDDMAAMGRRHAEELAAVRRREEDAALLGTLTAQVWWGSRCTFMVPSPHKSGAQPEVCFLALELCSRGV
jgi:hypothetical protein